MATRQEVILGSAGRLRRKAVSERRWANAALYVGVGILGLVGLMAIFAPLIAPYPPNAQDLVNAFQPPSADHIMGTDNLGRDIFSRVVYAARIDLQIGFITTYVPLVYGVILGAIAGYFGGWVDSVIMRLVDVVIAFPFLVLVIAILAVVGPGVKGIYIAVLAVAWAMYARLTRAEMLVLREQQFMLAGEALGFSRRRIILRHAIPNLLRPNLVFSMADFVLNILLVASLSFLGLGVRPPTPEWGAMVAEGQNFLLNAWWITTFPGIVIVVVGIALSLVGDGLADRLGERFRLTVDSGSAPETAKGEHA
jgi:peptide/nickel transport system permease protein